MREFYANLLGLSEIAVPGILSQDLLWFSLGNDRELHFFPDSIDHETKHHYCLEVDDLEELRARLEQSGSVPFDDGSAPGRSLFFCRDPVGNLVEFTRFGARLEPERALE